MNVTVPLLSDSEDMRVLVIEDDETTRAYLTKGLSEHGYQVAESADGRDGLYQALGGGFDAIITDRMLPGLDGLAIVQALRSAKIQTPVLILSALAQVDERVRGLKAGGDDYLAKPFAFTELTARLEALMRRPAKLAQDTQLSCGDLQLDLLSRRVTRGGEEIDLQPRELKILEFLLRHVDRVVTRTMLLEGVWDYHFDPQTNVVDVHMSRLRQKIDKGYDKPLLHTLRGVGYRLSTRA